MGRTDCGRSAAGGISRGGGGGQAPRRGRFARLVPAVSGPRNGGGAGPAAGEPGMGGTSGQDGGLGPCARGDARVCAAIELSRGALDLYMCAGLGEGSAAVCRVLPVDSERGDRGAGAGGGRVAGARAGARGRGAPSVGWLPYSAVTAR